MSFDPYVYTPDHVKQGLSRLIEQYKNKPLAKGLITSYLNRVQELEDAVRDLYNARQFKPGGAFGIYLDRFGKIVGAKRNSSDDTAYFIYIQAQIAINKSSGTVPEFFEICRLLAGQTPLIREAFPASIDIEILVNTFSTDAIKTLAQAFHGMVVDGVRLSFLYPPNGVDSTNAFTFWDEDPAHATDAARGWGSVYDPTAGGKFIAVA
jgi:hypothetical protein